MKEFTNVVFDTKEKIFTIKEGDTGTYSYLDITNCNIISNTNWTNTKGRHRHLNTASEVVYCRHRYGIPITSGQELNLS